jgi:hypothetical protein
MNAPLLVHFIQKISSYYGRCPGTSESRCSLEEYDIDVSFDRGVAGCLPLTLRVARLGIPSVLPPGRARKASKIV